MLRQAETSYQMIRGRVHRLAPFMDHARDLALAALRMCATVRPVLTNIIFRQNFASHP